MNHYLIFLIIGISIPSILIGIQADNIINKTIDGNTVYFVNIHNQKFTGVVIVTTANPAITIEHSSYLNITKNTLIGITEGKGKLYHTKDYSIPLFSCWYLYLPCELISEYKTPSTAILILQYQDVIKEINEEGVKV